MHDDMLDGLKWLAAWASNLFRGVLQEEALCVFTNEGVPCYDPVERRQGRAGKLSGVCSCPSPAQASACRPWA
jgi:hypothetical protein